MSAAKFVVTQLFAVATDNFLDLCFPDSGAKVNVEADSSFELLDGVESGR